MSEELNPNELLSAEYEYLARSSFQNIEDRAGVGLLYVLTVGGILAAFIVTGLESVDRQFTSAAFAGVFLLLSVYAVLAFLKIIRLRQAWQSNIAAMDQLKAYFIEHNEDQDLAEALAWSAATIPPKSKAWSLAFLTALQIALAGGAAISVTVIFLGFTLIQSLEVWIWIIALLVAIIYIVDLLIVYWWLLRETGGRNEA
jgi:hypothetical protein